MITLNQLASSTASLLKEPFNHELKERLIDSYKQYIALRIRHSVERHGIDELLKLNYVEEIQVLDNDDDEVQAFFDIYDTYTEEEIEEFKFLTRNRVFEPVRIQNESPFTFVGTVDRSISFPYRSRSHNKFSHSLFSTGDQVSYCMDNGRILLQCHDIDKLILVPEIEIEAIFYESEKVVTLFDNEDGLDRAIPLPHDVITGITHEMLQKEFGIISPYNLEVKVNEGKKSIQ